MIKVTEATEAHFNQVFQLLQRLNNTHISKEKWKTCFKNPFSSKTNYAGYALWDGDELVGFFGALYSDRIIGGTPYRFCNTHSWIVLPEYRMKGLLLLNKMHKQKGYVLTNFSASEGPYAIMKQLGWIEKDNHYGIIWKQFWPSYKGERSLQFSPAAIDLDIMNEQEKKIFQHHKSFNCQMNIVKNGHGHSLQVFKEIPYAPSLLGKFNLHILLKLKLGQLYYASNPDLYFNQFEENISGLCRQHGWVGMVIHDQYIRKYGLRVNRRYMKHRPVLYKSDINFDPQELDLLYSEIFALDLN